MDYNQYSLVVNSGDVTKPGTVNEFSVLIPIAGHIADQHHLDDPDRAIELSNRIAEAVEEYLNELTHRDDQPRVVTS